jgi:hypothetical protein
MINSVKYTWDSTSDEEQTRLQALEENDSLSSKSSSQNDENSSRHKGSSTQKNENHPRTFLLHSVDNRAKYMNSRTIQRIRKVEKQPQISNRRESNHRLFAYLTRGAL